MDESLCGFFKRSCLALQQCIPLAQSPLGFAGRNLGDLSSWHWNPGVGLELLTPEISLPIFYPPHLCERPALPTPASLLPVWMDVVSLIPWLSDFCST